MQTWLFLELMLVANSGTIVNYMAANRVRRSKLLLVAVNAAAGADSEVTGFATITDPITSVKLLIVDPHLIPKVD